MTGTDPHEADLALAELASAIAREAGALLLAGATQVRAVATKSSPHDLVTQMDGESERLIRGRIAEHRPGDAVLGEEQGGAAAGTAGTRWIVDPLDGTVNYFYGLPSWAVSIGIEVDGVPRVGVVVAPALAEEYVGVAGSGSWLVAGERREPLAVSRVDRLADAVVSTGFGYLRERRAAQGRVVAELLPRIRDIRRVGAAAVDLCWVARGRVDAHFERGLQPWDSAAGALIAQEAGAVVTGLSGRPHSPAMTVAANPALCAELVGVLEELDAAAGP